MLDMARIGLANREQALAVATRLINNLIPFAFDLQDWSLPKVLGSVATEKPTIIVKVEDMPKIKVAMIDLSFPISFHG